MTSTIPPLITLEGEYDEYRTPKFLGPALSIHSRPGLDQTPIKQESKARMPQDPESFHRLILYVTMVSRDGRPFSGHVATAASTALDKFSLLRHPQRPCLLLTL
jgi:hypothetical protein